MRSVLVAGVLGAAAADHWAVIMAGSNTYKNYAHQADACHAYQIAKKHGIPESNIILLSYDDVAHSSSNPFPGKLFNKPDGPDVYAGCKMAYKGKQVTATNFLKVLKGDTSAPGPVLKSTAEDRVFVYYADHGGQGILGVPSGDGDVLYARDINDAIETLHQKGGYKELIFYVEACHSGSIFQGLLKAPNAFAVTSSTAKQQSFFNYCPPDDRVNGREINSCLGGELSNAWMADADVADFKTETVNEQVATVKQNVRSSSVTTFGDSSTIGKEVIGAFEGAEVTVAGNVSLAYPDSISESPVNAYDVEVHLAYYKLKRAETIQERRAAEEALSDLLAQRRAADEKFMRIAMLAMGEDKEKAQAMLDGTSDSLGDVECHVQALKTVVGSCGPFNDYTLQYSRLFVNLCATISATEVEASVKQACADEIVV